MMEKAPQLKCIQTLLDFFTEKIWNADFRALRFLKRVGYSLCRLLIVAIRGFFEDRCTLQSCALTYITMISLVPILALALSFCRGIGLQRQLLAHLGIETLVQENEDGSEKQRIYRIVKAEDVVAAESAEGSTTEAAAEVAAADEGLRPAGEIQPGFAAELPEPMQDAAIKLIGYVDRTNFAALGVIGVLTLLCTAITSIRKLENNFNDIWCIRRGRSWLRQISEYLVVLLLLPVLLFCVLSLSAFINSGNLAQMLHTHSPIIIYWGHFFAKSLLFACLIAAFAALYLFMPNTHVRIGPALISGTLAAILWGIVLLAYLKWQIGLAKYNAIYGTFAALPFFLAWLYANWLVVLLGAEVCYAAQNQRLLRKTKRLLPVEAGAARLLGIAVANSVSQSFQEGKGCWKANEFAMSNNVSIRELEYVLSSLTKAGIVIQRCPESEPPESYEYLLARPADQITVAQLSNAFVGLDTDTALRIRKCLPESLAQFLKERHQENVKALEGVTLADLGKKG